MTAGPALGRVIHVSIPVINNLFAFYLHLSLMYLLISKNVKINLRLHHSLQLVRI